MTTHSDSAVTVARVGAGVEITLEAPSVRLTVAEAEAVVLAIERAIEQTKRSPARMVVH